MKILGVGVDLIKNSRIKILIKSKPFIMRTYGKNEIKLSENIKNKRICKKCRRGYK